MHSSIVKFFFLVLLSLPATSVRADSVDEAFEKVRRTFLSRYSSLVLERTGLKLEIRLDENAPRYFGGMNIEAGVLFISIGSEAHREPKVTPDSYMALLCHEVGHRLGGAPYKQGRGEPAWSSSEGQSDYYAASVCLPNIFSQDPETDQMTFAEVPQFLHQQCARNSSVPSKVCLRVARAGKQMMDSVRAIYEEYPNPPPAAEYATPEVAGGSEGALYPTFQCRLDTFVHGALRWERPGCWYAKP